VELTPPAPSARVQQSVTLRVTARDADGHTLRFTWEAAAGTLGTPSSTAASSEVTWTAPDCGGRGSGSPSVTVTVSDEKNASTSRAVPVSVPRCRALLVAGGGNYSLARLEDGTVWASGNNADGQLGDGTTTVRATPVRVPGLTGVSALAAGGGHSLAVRGAGAAAVDVPHQVQHGVPPRLAPRWQSGSERRGGSGRSGSSGHSGSAQCPRRQTADPVYAQTLPAYVQ
jgi:hypothetical protein